MADIKDNGVHGASSEGCPASRALPDPHCGRSCINCYQRKVQCDRTLPCNPCARSGLTCIYPVAKRCLPKTAASLQDVSDRLERLERLLVEALGGDSIGDRSSSRRFTQRPISTQEVQKVPVLSAKPTHDRNSHSRPWEALLQAGNRAHYVNNTNLLDLFQDDDRINPPELQEIHKNTPSSLSGLNLTPGLPPIVPDPDSDLSRLYPDAQLTLRLWTVYTERVDPVLKILHIPTIQSAMVATISESEPMNPSLEALTFAIYFASATSLSDDEVLKVSPETRQTLLQRCKLGLNQAITKADLLNEPNLTTLQALAIFATCLRAHDNSRAVWVLIGTAIRLAQSIGIHRDGASLKLTPLESELRLRLWWHLYILDSRASEDHGFSNTIENQAQGLRLPLNVDDAQLYPAMESLPPDSEKWTQATFSLVQIEATRLLQEILGAKSRSDPETIQHIEAKRMATTRHNQWMETRFFSLSPASGVRNASRSHYYTACTKIEFMLQLGEELYVRNSNYKERPCTLHRGLKERPFRTACRTLEMSCSLREISMKYTWLFNTYTQWYALAYVLRYLCAFPTAPEAGEVWVLVNQTFNSIPYAQKLPSGQLAPESTGRNSIWKCLAWLRYQALNSKTTAQGHSTSVTEPLDPSPQTCPYEEGIHANAAETGLQSHFSDLESCLLSDMKTHRDCLSLLAVQTESSCLPVAPQTQLSDQWESEFPSFSELVIPEMLCLPEWNDIF